MLTSLTALLAACFAFFTFDVISFKNTIEKSMHTLASIVADNSTAALTFGDAGAAEEVLGSLKAQESILAACIFDKNGKIFAQYLRPGSGFISIHGEKYMHSCAYMQVNGSEIFFVFRKR